MSDAAGQGAAEERAASFPKPPLLCVVTDRRRLRASGDERGQRGDRGDIEALLAQVTEAAQAAIDFVQLREPDLSTNRLVDLATRAVAAVAAVDGSPTRIVVNDRLDVALAAGAHGVHLRGVSADAPRVRAAVRQARERGVTLPADFFIGRSVHGVDEAVAAESLGGLDYFILGTMFPTASKTGPHTVVGPGAVRAAARVCRLPILAIGGITLDNVREVIGAGAAGIAAIGLFLGRQAPGAGRARPLRDVAADVRRLFAERHGR